MNASLIAPLVALATVLATLLGGGIALRSHNRLHLVLGLSGGLLLGLVAFDLLPEVFGHSDASDYSLMGVPLVALALVFGFISLHTVERVFGQHEPLHSDHEHSHGHASSTGVIGAVALAIHVFLDGLALAVAFKVGGGLGLAVAIAVLAHAFSDGLNTVALLAGTQELRKRGWQLLAVDGTARVSGAVLGSVIALNESFVKLYLAAFAGALIYLATAHILPEAHSRHASKLTLATTFAGIALMFFIAVGVEGAH